MYDLGRATCCVSATAIPFLQPWQQPWYACTYPWRRPCRRLRKTPPPGMAGEGAVEDLISTIASIVANDGGGAARALVFSELTSHILESLPPAAHVWRQLLSEVVFPKVCKELETCTTESVRKRIEAPRTEFMLQFLERLAASLQRLLDEHNIPFKLQPGDVLTVSDIDHILPSSRGGPDSAFNFMLLLSSINRSLGASLPFGDDRKAKLLPP